MTKQTVISNPMPQLCKQVFDVEGSSCADYKPQEIILGSRQCGVCVLVGSKLRGRKKGWGKKKERETLLVILFTKCLRQWHPRATVPGFCSCKCMAHRDLKKALRLKKNTRKFTGFHIQSCWPSGPSWQSLSVCV